MIQDHLKKIVLSHYEEGEAPVKCVSKKKKLWKIMLMKNKLE